MRLLIDLQGAQNDSRFRGIGRYVNALLCHLIATRAQSDEIILLLNAGLADGESEVRACYSSLLPIQNFRIWSPLMPSSWAAPTNRARRLSSQAIREWAINEISPDCVLVTSLFEGCGDDVVTSIPANNRPPTAVIFYDLIPYLFPDLYLDNSRLRGWYAEKLGYLQTADLLLTISQASRHEAISHLGMSDEQVINISSGIDANLFRRLGAPWPEASKKYGVSGSYLLYTGAADPRKNLDAFLKAFGSLPATEIRNVSVVMVGQITKGQKSALEKIAKLLPRGKRQLVFAGHVSDDELISFYRHALAFVFPSIHEGFGLPLLEAMAAGCPVIASNCSAFPEVVGVPESLFDPTSLDSMAVLIGRVIRDPEFRTWLVNEQSARIDLFSWTSVAERTWSALRQLAPVKQTAIPSGGRMQLIDLVAEQLKIAGASLSDFALAAEAIEMTIEGVRGK